MQGIFQDLKPPNRDRLDLLHQKTSFSVLAVDIDSGQLHLDAPVVSKGFSKWMAGDVTFQPDIINDVVIQVPDASLFERGDLVEQFCTLADTNSLHAELLEYWTPTWQAMSTVDAHTWQRVTSFFHCRWLGPKDCSPCLMTLSLGAPIGPRQFCMGSSMSGEERRRCYG